MSYSYTYHRYPHYYPGQDCLDMLKDMSKTMSDLEIAREIKCHPMTVKVTLKRDGISCILTRRIRGYLYHKTNERLSQITNRVQSSTEKEKLVEDYCNQIGCGTSDGFAVPREIAGEDFEKLWLEACWRKERYNG